MNYNNPVRNNSTFTIRVMCAIVFVVFSFAWLDFQADMLDLSQHVLSGGVTRYHRFIGSLVITCALFLLQLFVYFITRLKRRLHALTYLPSMLLMSLLSDVSLTVADEPHSSVMWWALPIIAIWLLVVFIAMKAQQVEDDRSYSLLSRPMWINMLVMCLMMMGVAWLGNTNAVFHYRMKMEGLLSEGDYTSALEVGKKSLESDEHVLMLRMYALARANSMGERLFEYSVKGAGSQILPTNGASKMLLCSADSIYKFLGARPAVQMTPERYLQMLLRRDSVPRKTIGDYLLCGYLIDKDVDRFAQEIGKYYTVDEHLPKHYREALTMYTHLRSNPVLVYHVPVMEEDYRNMLDMEKKYAGKMERKEKLRDQFAGTYWYYYKYE